MEQAIQDFIDGNRIAVVGMSRSGGKFGNMASKEYHHPKFIRKIPRIDP